MSVRDPEDLAGLRRVGRVVARALRAMADGLRPGITTAALDAIAAGVLRRFGAHPAPALAYGFPGTACISVNDEIAHGIPGGRVIRAGDLVNLDVSAELDGFFADTGASFPVPPVRDAVRSLCGHTRRALRDALAAMRPGRPINGTGRAVERAARRGRLHAVRDLSAHGTGRALHEEPLDIANHHDTRDRRRFTEGIVIAMETFLSTGSPHVVAGADGWTLRTADGCLAAQYEHTVVVTSEGPAIMTVP